MENENKVRLIFSAIDKYETQSIMEPTETDSHKGFITCGKYNDYLEYLNELYRKVTILKSCVDTSTDFTCGNSITVGDPVWDNRVNDRLDNIEDLTRAITKDYFIYGGFAINVVRNRAGQIAGLYHIPFERLRSNEYNTEFYYSKDWSKSYGRVRYTAYPKFDPEKADPSSIFYFNNNKGITTYPIAPWATALECAEMQKKINEFHLNSLANGFAGSYMITFNNGVPNEKQADEIERDIIEKFSGTENAGRIAISFADSKDHAAEIQKLEVDDFGTKYESLMVRSRDEILNAFRLNGQLIGINKENIGFNTQEFDDAFKLFNRTVIRPVQKILARTYSFILGKEITIVPFSLTEDCENKVIE